MESIAYCSRCRGMWVGWNRKYVWHYLACKELSSQTVRFLICIVFVSSLILALPVPTGFVLSDLNPLPVTEAVAAASFVPAIDPALESIGRLLKHYAVQEEHRDRVAKAIVENSRKEDIDPKLVASVVIIESRANPFAISDRNSVGIMQIHLPTWGTAAEKENINLFKVEDNISFGTKILKRYVAQYGLWNGVRHYKGWIDTPESQQNAEEYAQKVKQIYQPE